MASSMKKFDHLEIQLQDIKSATNNFHEENVIGKGGFGKVYKGELSHSNSTGKSLVALKRLDRQHGQGDTEFYKEVRLLSCYRHENIISLLGFCSGLDKEMILIYEYASHGSLDGHLKDVTLTWTQRIKVCLDAAKGLCYLHDPRETYQRLIHCDIKSANILLDENYKAKVSDFGLSKIAPANPQNSILVTSALGTYGYCDPQFMETYSLTKESDVYSFGVVLFEVLCGKVCFEIINGQLKVLVPMWKQSYEKKQLSGIVFQGLMEQMNPDSLETFSDIAYRCLKRFREERPAMSLVVEKLQESLAMQELHDLKPPKEYEEIVNAAVPPLKYRSLDELKVLLTKGFHVNEGKTWFSINDKGEHYGMISIQDCLIQDDPSRGYTDRYSSEKNSRFKVGCYKTHLMEFKLHVRTPLFLSRDVTYGLNLVFHCSEREKTKQQHVGVRYRLQGEPKFSILRFADERQDKPLVAELYKFTSNEEGIQDLEILLVDCGLSGDFYIEGIELQPLEKVKHPVVVANEEEIVRIVERPLFYRMTEELKVLLSQGVLLNGGKMWLLLNKKEQHCLIISIEDCLIHQKRDYSAQYSFEKSSRFTAGCYRTNDTSFKLRVPVPLLLSPNVKYGLNLVFQYEEREQMNQQYVPVRYTLQGEKKISFVYFADRRKDGWLVAELYQLTSDSNESITDLEIIIECCQLSDYLYIEGIEFQPLERVEQPAVEYEEILKAAVPHLLYRSAEELKVLLFRGIFLNGGKRWFSINDKEEHCLMLSIEDCLIPDDTNRYNSYRYSLKKNSRFAVGCYETEWMNFKIRVQTPLFLSQNVTYGLNLVFHYSEKVQTKQVILLVTYKLQGETYDSVVHFANTREDERQLARLYQFTNDGDMRMRDLEISIERSDLSGYFHIEGIEFQPLERVEHPVVAVQYEEILKAAVNPLLYTSEDALKVLLTRGILLKGPKKRFCVNEKRQHIERSYISGCLDLTENIYENFVYVSGDKANPRFLGRSGDSYSYRYTNKFKAHVNAQFLSPGISYTVNLVCRYKSERAMKYFNPIRYKIDEEEKKVFILYPGTHAREDGWFIVPLHHFNTQHKTADLKIVFERRRTKLLVVGIEFQPSEEKVDLHNQVFEEYQDIVKAASQSIVYTSLDELKEILSIGVHVNGYKTWCSLNEEGQRCEMISIEECLIQEDTNECYSDRYEPHWQSRFPAGVYQTNKKGFKTHVKTGLLSPSIAYTVNLVLYSSSEDNEEYVNLKYRLRGETTTATVYLANLRNEDCLYMAELYQFTSDGSIFDLDIDFEDHETNIKGIEGILFQPLEKMEDQVLKDNKVEDVQTISDSDSDTYWEQKVPNNYQEILELSKYSVKWKTKMELYSILRKGFLIGNGQQWLNVNLNGKKCQMLSARATCVIDDRNSTWESSNESRFGELLVITAGDKFKLVSETKPVELSPDTTYASFLVYNLPQDQSTFESPLEVMDNSYGCYLHYKYSYLVSPPNTPVIGQKFDENSRNPLNRHTLNTLPRRRSDGWMEVKVWDFETENTCETVSMDLMVEHPGKKDLCGLMIQGIEIRPTEILHF